MITEIYKHTKIKEERDFLEALHNFIYTVTASQKLKITHRAQANTIIAIKVLAIIQFIFSAILLIHIFTT